MKSSPLLKKENRTVANFISTLRILGTLILLFVAPMSTAFLIIYTLTGITDALDGFVARVTNTKSHFGAKLDSVADLLLYTIMLIKIIPFLKETVSFGMWTVIGMILIIRMLSYIVVAVKHRQFASLHTKLNKLCGFCVFCVPYLTLFSFAKYAFIVVIAVGAAASVEELFIHCKKEKTENADF